MHRFYRPELDALRFFAFTLVFIFHSSASVGGPEFLSFGEYGVDLFFLLSAYLITELFRRIFELRVGRRDRILQTSRSSYMASLFRFCFNGCCRVNGGD